MLQHMVHREEALTTDAWMLGLKHDLQWLCRLEPTGVPPLASLSLASDAQQMDLTELIDFWQSGAPLWKACVKRAAWRKHVRQETMMVQVHGMHWQFFQILRDGGQATFAPSPFEQPEARPCHHPCHCGRQFTTPQGLASHCRLCHGEFALSMIFSNAPHALSVSSTSGRGNVCINIFHSFPDAPISTAVIWPFANGDSKVSLNRLRCLPGTTQRSAWTWTS